MTPKSIFSTPDYHIFDASFDEERHVGESLAKLKEVEPARIDSLAAALLERVGRVPEVELVDTGDTRPVTLLLDCSGSMRGYPILVQVTAVARVGDALAAQGRPFEILGFTTRTLKGGNSYEAWREAGRPTSPGRLCDLLHLTFKSLDETWEEARLNLSYVFDQGLLKDNIDGEALAWAASRIVERAEDRNERGTLVLVSDGHPVEDRTLSTNPQNFLLDHLIEIKKQVRRELDLSIVSLSYPDEVLPAHPEAVRVHIESGSHRYEEPANELANAILSCIGNPTPAPGI